MNMFPPRRVAGVDPQDIEVGTLRGKLFAWSAVRNSPVLLGMPGSASDYLALFSSEEKLREMFTQANIEFDSIKEVSDSREFLASVYENRGVLVIVDPYFTESGTVRYLQLDFAN